jgi:hypothetical protein
MRYSGALYASQSEHSSAVLGTRPVKATGIHFSLTFLSSFSSALSDIDRSGTRTG